MTPTRRGRGCSPCDHPISGNFGQLHPLTSEIPPNRLGSDDSQSGTNSTSRLASSSSHGGPIPRLTKSSNLDSFKGPPLAYLAPVGDKYVLEEMLRCDANLGGEQSGHVIFGGDHTTGDGLLSALRVAEIVTATGRPLDALVSELKPFPQVIRNVPVRGKVPLEEHHPGTGS